jgi:iron complex outermembrane receptor protein
MNRLKIVKNCLSVEAHRSTALPGFRLKDWDLRAALNNISDKNYVSSATSAAQLPPGEPRSLVVTGTYSF